MIHDKLRQLIWKQMQYIVLHRDVQLWLVFVMNHSYQLSLVNNYHILCMFEPRYKAESVYKEIYE